jgi:hypothetical protein
MGLRRFGCGVDARRTGAGAVVLALVALLASSVAVAGAQPGNSAATITASFGDSCRDLTAHSSKDISHVEIHYADGRVVKDEAIDARDFLIDGGDEVGSAIVKSGTTADRFDCDSAPVTACSDGADNDANGLTDYPDDPGCASAGDDEELSDNGDGLD